MALAEMARLLDDPETQETASELAAHLAGSIEERYWLEDEGLLRRLDRSVQDRAGPPGRDSRPRELPKPGDE